MAHFRSTKVSLKTNEVKLILNRNARRILWSFTPSSDVRWGSIDINATNLVGTLAPAQIPVSCGQSYKGDPCPGSAIWVVSTTAPTVGLTECIADPKDDI